MGARLDWSAVTGRPFWKSRLSKRKYTVFGTFFFFFSSTRFSRLLDPISPKSPPNGGARERERSCIFVADQHRPPLPPGSAPPNWPAIFRSLGSSWWWWFAVGLSLPPRHTLSPRSPRLFSAAKSRTALPPLVPWHSRRLIAEATALYVFEF